MTCPDCHKDVEPAPMIKGAVGWAGASRFCPTPTGPLSRCGCDFAARMGPDGKPLLAPPEELREHPLEMTIQEQIEKYLKGLAPDVWFFRMVVGVGYRRDKTGREYEIHYGEPGVADVVVCARGRWLELEVKSAKGRQEDSQRKHEKKITGAHGKYFIVRSLDEARCAVEETLALVSRAPAIATYEAGVKYYQEQCEALKRQVRSLGGVA